MDEKIIDHFFRIIMDDFRLFVKKKKNEHIFFLTDYLIPGDPYLRQHLPFSL